MVVFNGQAVAFGGTTKAVSDFPTATADLITFDPRAVSSSWRHLQTQGVGPCARAGHAMCLCEGYVIMFIPPPSSSLANTQSSPRLMSVAQHHVVTTRCQMPPHSFTGTVV
jgi:hypothetical protein